MTEVIPPSAIVWGNLFDIFLAIMVQFVNNDHTPLSPDVSKIITVNVTSPPATNLDPLLIRLTGLTDGQSTLQTWAMVNTAGIVIALILILIVLMRKK